MPENVVGDVHVSVNGVRYTYLGSRSFGWHDVAIQPAGEEESRHTVSGMVWRSIVEGSAPLTRAEA